MEMLEKRPACPQCESPVASARLLFSLRHFESVVPVVECAVCGLVYKSLIPTASAFSTIYNSNYGHYSTAAFDHDVKILVDRVGRLRPLKPTGRLFDYGCGNGAFIAAAGNAGYDAWGADPFLPAPHALANNYLRERAFKLAIGSAEFDRVFPPGSFDIVTMWATAEHLVSVGANISGLIRLLRPDGVLVLNCPAGDSLACRRDGVRWRMAIIPEHLQFITCRSARYAAELGGAELIKLRRCGSPYPFGLEQSATTLDHKRSNDPPQAPSAARTAAKPKRSTLRAAYDFFVIDDSLHLKATAAALIQLLGTGDHLEVYLRLKR